MTSNTFGLTRKNIGPLPTASFSRPTSCNTPWIQGACYYGVTCSSNDADIHIETDASCYPSGWASHAAYAVLSLPFYSPASICPSGFTSACNVTRNVFDQVPGYLTFGMGAVSQTLYVLTDGETAIGCCPTGWQCHTYWPGSCMLTLAPPTTVSGKTFGRSCVSSPTVTTILSTSGIDLYEQPSQLQVVLVHNPDKDNQTSSGGLSAGAKIGLGLGIPLGVLIVAAFSFFCYRRSKRTEKERARQEAERRQNRMDEDPVLPPEKSKAELKGSEVTVIPGRPQGPVRPRQELETEPVDAATVHRDGLVADDHGAGTESSTGKSKTDGRAELDQQPSATVTSVAELDSNPYRHELEA